MNNIDTSLFYRLESELILTDREMRIANVNYQYIYILRKHNQTALIESKSANPKPKTMGVKLHLLV